MLYFSLAWLALIALSLPIGLAILSAVRASAIERSFDRAAVAVWLGLLLLGNMLLAAAFLFALTPVTGAAFGLGLAGVSLCVAPVRAELRKLRSRLTPGVAAGAAVLLAGVALFSAQQVVWTDTGLYHAGTMRWLSEFGAVEGLGLLQHRLGFSSSWLALGAPFNSEDLRDHASAVLGGLVLLLLVGHVLVCLKRALDGRARTSDWLMLAGSALLLVILPTQKVHVSANPDVPVAVLTLIAGWTIAIIAEQRGRQPDSRVLDARLIVLLLALGAFTVKAQAGPLVVVAALYYVFGGPAIRRTAVAAGLGIVVIAPWSAYAFVTTGCPAFPLPVCVDVPWSVGTDVAQGASDVVLDWARWRGAPPAGDSVWFDDWLTREISRPLAALGLASALLLAGGLAGRVAAPPERGLRHFARWIVLIGALGVAVFLLRAQSILLLALVAASLIPARRSVPGAGWLAAIGLSGVAFTMYTGPDPRFALGYLAVLLGRLAIVHGEAVWRWSWEDGSSAPQLPRQRLGRLLGAAGSLAAAAVLVLPTNPAVGLTERVGLVVPPPTVPDAARETSNGIAYQVAVLCWAIELPCVQPGAPIEQVRLRDPDRGIAGGFESEASP